MISQSRLVELSFLPYTRLQLLQIINEEAYQEGRKDQKEMDMRQSAHKTRFTKDSNKKKLNNMEIQL